jgi:predicted aconitase with swiveling domain
MSAPLAVIRVERAAGPLVEGEALLSAEGFSPRYDLDRWSGVITKPGHRLEGASIVGRILFFPTAKGGIAAGWAFHDLVGKRIAPRAFVFGVTNPVMVQGAIYAGIAITEGWSPDPFTVLASGDLVRVDPARRVIELLERRRADSSGR